MFFCSFVSVADILYINQFYRSSYIEIYVSNWWIKNDGSAEIKDLVRGLKRTHVAFCNEFDVNNGNNLALEFGKI